VLPNWELQRVQAQMRRMVGILSQRSAHTSWPGWLGCYTGERGLTAGGPSTTRQGPTSSASISTSIIT
jgi:hypothetical protein